MKKILFGAFFLPLTVLGQKPKIPNHTNTIILSGVSKAQLKDSLAHAGFTSIDKDSSHFQTLPRQFKRLDHGNLIIYAEVVDSGIVLTGAVNQIDNEALLNPYGNRYQWVRKTALGTPNGEAFEIMKTFAAAQPARIYFKKSNLGKYSSQ